MSGEDVIEAARLGKRYGRTWALRDCTLSVPAGRVVAFVGPNGAGKTTFLHLAVGLTEPTIGGIAVLGSLVPGGRDALSRIAFVAQDTPLYPGLTVAATLTLVESLSERWYRDDAQARLATLGIPLDRKVGKLSGGQRAQVALAVALARRPDLLVLDEPVASLDPLARHDFMAMLMTEVAERGLSVVLSSHVVSELERVCDYLVVLAGGQIQVAGDVEHLVAEHHVLTGPTAEAADVSPRYDVVREKRAGRQTTLLVRSGRTITAPRGWQRAPTNLEELVLSYLRAPDAKALPGPSLRAPA